MADWFEPKRFGIGAGLPIAWQGWAILFGYLVLVIGSAFLLGNEPLALVAICLPATLVLILVAIRTTRGGWRWRWGEKD